MIVSFIEFSLEYKLSFSRIVCVDCTFSNSIERCNLRSWLCPQSNSETVFQTSLLGSPFSGLPSYKFGFRSSVQKNRPPAGWKTRGSSTEKRCSHKWFHSIFPCTDSCTNTFCTSSPKLLSLNLYIILFTQFCFFAHSASTIYWYIYWYIDVSISEFQKTCLCKFSACVMFLVPFYGDVNWSHHKMKT